MENEIWSMGNSEKALHTSCITTMLLSAAVYNPTTSQSIQKKWLNALLSICSLESKETRSQEPLAVNS